MTITNMQDYKNNKIEFVNVEDSEDFDIKKGGEVVGHILPSGEKFTGADSIMHYLILGEQVIDCLDLTEAKNYATASLTPEVTQEKMRQENDDRQSVRTMEAILKARVEAKS